MNFMDMLTFVSLAVGFSSLTLALVTIHLARAAQKDSRDTFDLTRKMMSEYYDKTKDVLSQIDKRATVIEKTVTDAQEKLMTTITSIVNKTIFPEKEDFGERMGVMFLQKMMQDPGNAGKMVEAMKPLIELGEKQQAKKEIQGD